MGNHDPEAMGGSKDAGDGFDGSSADRGRKNHDMEILYGNMGSFHLLDQLFSIAVFVLVAWPDQWIRVAAVLMFARASMGNYDVEWKSVKIKSWERRVAFGFLCVLLLSKLVWRVVIWGSITGLVRFLIQNKTQLLYNESSRAFALDQRDA
jgi:hypothetical protein